MNNSPRPLNVVWRRQRIEEFAEAYFIKEILLGGLDRPVRLMPIEDFSEGQAFNDVLIISLRTEAANFLRDLRARGCRNLGFFHAGDEHGTDNRAFYGAADYVIRHYWHRGALAPPNEQSLGIVWVPNGYRTGVGPIERRTTLGMNERHLMGFFAGALADRTFSGERNEMVQTIRQTQLPFYLVETSGFPQKFGPVSYAAHLANARFALVPSGNSPETIRLYDALEAGAIPITLKSPYLTQPEALDGLPVVALDRWSDLPAFYAQFADANAPAVIARLDGMQRAVIEGWASFKRRQQEKVKALVDRSFARSL